MMKQSDREKQAQFVYDELGKNWNELTEEERQDIKENWNYHSEEFLRKARWIKVIFGKGQNRHRWEAVYSPRKQRNNNR